MCARNVGVRWLESKSDLWKFLQPSDFLWLGAITIAFVVSSILLLLYNPLIFALGIAFPIVFTVGGTYGILRLIHYLTVKETYYIQCNFCHYTDKIKKGAYRTGDGCPRCGTGTLTKYVLIRDKKKGDVIDPFE